MSDIYDLDIAAIGNNATPPDGAPENMEYDEVNDTLRELMALLARYQTATFGGITSAGSQPAYTLVSGQTLGGAYADGMAFGFLAHATSTGNVTLNVDGIGAVAVRDSRGNQLGSGDILQNGFYFVVKTTASWRVVGQLSAASVRALAAFTAPQTAGSSNAFTLTSGAFTAYADGLVVAFRADRANTGAATINIDSLGAEDLRDPDDAALAANDLVSGGAYLAVRVSSRWRVIAGLPVNLATQVSGLLAVANGGTGASTAATGWAALRQTASETVEGAVEMATDAEIRAATTGAKALMAEDLETAAAAVALTHASPTTLDWDAGINFTWAITASVTLSNPTNGQPGTWRRLQITQDATGSRVVTWGNQYVHPGGVDAVLSTAANAVDTLYIYCRTASIFEVHIGGKAWAT